MYGNILLTFSSCMTLLVVGKLETDHLNGNSSFLSKLNQSCSTTMNSYSPEPNPILEAQSSPSLATVYSMNRMITEIALGSTILSRFNIILLVYLDIIIST